jgi:hypothetical protein
MVVVSVQAEPCTKVAVMVSFWFSVTLSELFVLVKSPLQPLKIQLAAGVAVIGTTGPQA